MLVFDELAPSPCSTEPRDRRFRYPHLARLARDSRWYPNTTTVADDTTRGAGPPHRQPTGPDDLPTAQDHPNNLFTLLGRRYDFFAQEPVTALCPESLCGETERASGGNRLRSLWDDLSVVSAHLLLPEDLERDLPSVDASFEGFRNPTDGPAPAWTMPGSGRARTTGRHGSSASLGGIENAERDRSLHFLHILLPHVPYEYLPTGQRYIVGQRTLPGLFIETWVPDPIRPEQGHQRYLLQFRVSRTGSSGASWLGSKRAGLYDRALVVVTADHGSASARRSRGAS